MKDETNDDLSNYQTIERQKQYEEMISQLMYNQGISRGKAVRALEAHQRRVIKKFMKQQSKQIMAAQKRRDQGIPDPAPMTVLPEYEMLLGGVTEDNIHSEVLYGEPVGKEAI